MRSIIAPWCLSLCLILLGCHKAPKEPAHRQINQHPSTQTITDAAATTPEEHLSRVPANSRVFHRELRFEDPTHHCLAVRRLCDGVISETQVRRVDSVSGEWLITEPRCPNENGGRLMSAPYIVHWSVDLVVTDATAQKDGLTIGVGGAWYDNLHYVDGQTDRLDALPACSEPAQVAPPQTI